MSTRKLFAGALVSLLLSLAVYAVLAGLLSWFYYDAYFLSHPNVVWGPPPLVWVMGFWLLLSFFIPAIFVWWLVIFLVEQRRQASLHRRFASADLWLLVAAMLWGLMNFAVVMRHFPVEYHDCGDDFRGFIQSCSRPRPVHYWGVTGIATVVFMVGLVRRLRGIPRKGWLDDMDALRNDAVAAWIKTLPSERRLTRYLERLPGDVGDEVERSARAIFAAADAYLDEAAKAGDVDLGVFDPALKAHLQGSFPWMSAKAFGALRSYVGWYAWHEGYSVTLR